MGNPGSLSFLKNAAVYGLGSLLLQAAGFVLIPIYTRYLSPQEYGTLELLNRVSEALAIALLFNAFRQTAMTFYHRGTDPHERRRMTVTVVALVLGLSVSGIPALLLAANGLSEWLQVGTGSLLALALAAAVCEALVGLLMVFAQARQEAVTYVSVLLTQFFLRTGLVIFLVVFCGWGVPGILCGSLAVSGGVAATLLIREIGRARCLPDWRAVPAMLGFALPFLPGGLCFFVLHNGDRFFLLEYGGQEAVGTYALGYKLASVVGLVGCMPFNQVWFARMYEVARQTDAALQFGRYFSRLLSAYLLVGLGVCILQNEVIGLLGGRGYTSATLVVAPIVLAYFFMAASNLMDSAFYVRRQTIHKTWIALCSALVMFALYAVLIPRWIALGAALATLAGLAFHAALTLSVTRRLFPVHYEWPRLAGMLTAAVGLWLLALGLPADRWAIPLKLALWLLWPIIVWQAGWVTAEEKHFLVSLLSQGIERLGVEWRKRRRSDASVRLAGDSSRPVL